MIRNFHGVTIALVGTALLITLVIAGCRSPLIAEERSGSAPEIDRVNFYYYDRWDERFYVAYDFRAGETVYIELAMSDPDFDISVLDTSTRHGELGTVRRESVPTARQTAPTMWYYTSFEIPGPAGDGEVVLAVTDAAGNRSREYRKPVTVF